MSLNAGLESSATIYARGDAGAPFAMPAGTRASAGFTIMHRLTMILLGIYLSSDIIQTVH